MTRFRGPRHARECRRGALRLGARPPLDVALVCDDDELLVLQATLEAVDVRFAAGGVGELEARLDVDPPDAVFLDSATAVRAPALAARIEAAGAWLVTVGVQAVTEPTTRLSLPKPVNPLLAIALLDEIAAGVGAAPLLPFGPSLTRQHLGVILRELVSPRAGDERSVASIDPPLAAAALAATLWNKDGETGGHSRRARAYALQLTSALRPELLVDPTLEYGFLLHDLGKIAIPDSILRKPSPLTHEETRRMQAHTLLGARMLRGVDLLDGEGLNIVRFHHERWDGRGYPHALTGDEIPLSARIFAVADALDAMTTPRPYRARREWYSAFHEIVRGAATQFDPDVVDAFCDCAASLASIASGAAPSAARVAAASAEPPAEPAWTFVEQEPCDVGGVRVYVSEPERVVDLCDFLSRKGCVCVEADGGEAEVLVRGSTTFEAATSLIDTIGAWRGDQPEPIVVVDLTRF